MAKIEWDEQLSMGVEEVDNQHKELIRIANVLLKAVENKRETRILENVIRRLREYTVFHFNSEETLMEKVSYPKRGEHAQAHNSLKNKVKKYQRVIYKKETLDPERVLKFLKIWLLKHILEKDRDFANFLHGQQEAPKAPPAQEEDPLP